MHRPATWLALSLCCAAGASANDPTTSRLVPGSGKQLLSDGAAARPDRRQKPAQA